MYVLSLCSLRPSRPFPIELSLRLRKPFLHPTAPPPPFVTTPTPIIIAARRDVKARNIFITDGYHARLGDFSEALSVRDSADGRAPEGPPVGTGTHQVPLWCSASCCLIWTTASPPCSCHMPHHAPGARGDPRRATRRGVRRVFAGHRHFRVCRAQAAVRGIGARCEGARRGCGHAAPGIPARLSADAAAGAGGADAGPRKFTSLSLLPL